MQCPPSLYLLLSHSNEKVSPKKLLSSRVVGCWVKPLQCRLLQLRVWFQLLLFRSESLLTQLGSNRSSLRDLSSLHSHGRPSSRLLTSASPRLSFQTNKYLKRLHYYDYWYLTERCFSQMPVSAGTGSGRSQKAETPSRFPVGWWGPSSLEGKKLKPGAAPGTEPGTLPQASQLPGWTAPPLRPPAGAFHPCSWAGL